MTSSDSFGAMKYQWGHDDGVAEGEKKGEIKAIIKTLKLQLEKRGSMSDAVEFVRENMGYSDDDIREAVETLKTEVSAE